MPCAVGETLVAMTVVSSVSVSVSSLLFVMGWVCTLLVATGLVGVYTGEVGGDAVFVGDGGWLIIVGGEVAGTESEVVDSKAELGDGKLESVLLIDR